MKKKVALVLNISKLQTKHHDSVKWLLMGARASGRSHLMAIVFIEKAIQELGNWIEVFDHVPYRECPRFVLEVILKILTNSDVEFKMSRLHNSFKVTGFGKSKKDKNGGN